MNTKQTALTQNSPEQDLLTPEKQPNIQKKPQNQSEPIWKRNLSKIVKTKKIGEVARAKGGRY